MPRSFLFHPESSPECRIESSHSSLKKGGPIENTLAVRTACYGQQKQKWYGRI